MGHTDRILADVRSQIDADDKPLHEARDRLALVRSIAATFDGALRTYASGSLAVHTMNAPVTDGDGGLVLDRRCYPDLGPDGGGEPPDEVAAALCALLGPNVRKRYPNARCGTSKRGPKLTFGAPVEGQDPTVDLVVALTRRDAAGLWIPNLKKSTWEASHPEAHVALLNGGAKALRSTRRKAIRLAKAWNKQYTTPGLSSFHLSVWALEFVQPGQGVPAALHALFEGGACRLEAHQGTPDPAGVSTGVKLLLPASQVRPRLRKAADALADALDHDSDEKAVLAALHRVFWKYIDEPAGGGGLAAAVAALTSRRPVTTSSLGLAGPAALVSPTRAFGGPAPADPRDGCA